MISKVYIYETRQLKYLPYLLDRLSSQGFEPILFGKEVLDNDTDFNEFTRIYEHLSDNPYAFELNCFARYFAIRKLHKNFSENFIMADSDIYVSEKMFDVLNSKVAEEENCFFGSEGFTKFGSEHQIAPHFSIWNYNLLTDFIEFLFKSYQLNRETGFLKKEFEKRKLSLGTTAISDMTLLYSWVNECEIKFINTNSSTNFLNIDHNISSLYSSDCAYVSSFNRKKILRKDAAVFFKNKNGKTSEALNIIHFQGRYKQILASFYKKGMISFYLFSLYIYFARVIRDFYNKIQ